MGEQIARGSFCFLWKFATINDIDKEKATQALFILQNNSELSVLTNQLVPKHISSLDSDSASEHNSQILDSLKEGGGLHIFLQITNFTETKFRRLHQKIRNDLEYYLHTVGEKWMTGTPLVHFLYFRVFWNVD